MKISVVKNSPHYHDHFDKCEIYLDGVKLKYCIAADSDCGTAEVYKLDKKGNIMWSSANPFVPRIETRRGRVCIFVPEEYEHLF